MGLHCLEISLKIIHKPCRFVITITYMHLLKNSEDMYIEMICILCIKSNLNDLWCSVCYNRLLILLTKICFLVEILCDNLTTPSNGEIISCSSGIPGVGYEGDTCSFTCNTGYELTGSDTRTCQSNGSWSGSDDVCNRSKVHLIICSLFLFIIY